MKIIVAVFVLLIAVAVQAQQTDYSKVQIKATKVAGNVYMLEGAGGNIGVSVGDDGILIVDDEFAPLADKIRASLKTLGQGKLRFILNTHWHGDHTGGNVAFGPEAPIIAHDNVRKRLASGSTAGTRVTPPAPKQALPIVTFNDTATVHVNGEDVRAVHFPNGHTDGDAVIYFTQSNVVHMGDDFFNGHFPFIDLDAGGSSRGMLANVEKVLAALPDDVKVIPGHGDLGDKAALRRFADMLRGTIDVVSRALAAGQTVDQMKANHVLAQWDDWGKDWAISTDRFTELLARDLSRK